MQRGAKNAKRDQGVNGTRRIDDVPQVCHTMYEKVESPGKDWLVTLCFMNGQIQNDSFAEDIFLPDQIALSAFYVASGTLNFVSCLAR